MTFAFIGCYSQDMGHIKGALQENVYIYVEIHFVVSRDIFLDIRSEREKEREFHHLVFDFGMFVDIQYSMSVQVNTCEGVNVSICV